MFEIADLVHTKCTTMTSQQSLEFKPATTPQTLWLRRAQLLFEKLYMQAACRTIFKPIFSDSKMLRNIVVSNFQVFVAACIFASFCGTNLCQAQVRPTTEEAIERVKATFGPPPGFKELSLKGLVWINPERGMLISDGYVALRGGQLEMFACPIGTKEHESVIAVFGLPSWIHAGLLAVGANVGHPVRFQPFEPATGSTIKIYALWYDADGQKKVAAAQDWIVDAKTKKTMKLDWVFAGSIIDPPSKRYLADDGDFVTVANFSTATLDIAVRSDATNANLLFVPNTDAIPPLFTPVRLVFVVNDDAPRR